MSTPYSQSNQNFSNSAHNAAEHLIYPFVFGVEFAQIKFESTHLSSGEKGKILDGEMGIDWIACVNNSGLRKPIRHTIQERFRQSKFSQYDDLTVTSWNLITNQPSELYKIVSGLFIYGFFNGRDFDKWIAVDTTSFLISVSEGVLEGSKNVNPRSQQEFIAYNFSELRSCGCVLAELTNGKYYRKGVIV